MASPSGDMASTSRADKAIFQVISMNAGQKKEGKAQQRRKYVGGVINKKKPDLVFLQQFPSPALFRDEIPPGYQILQGVKKDKDSNYTTIFYKNELEVKGYNNYDNKSFAERLFVGRCKKDGSLDLIVASYHGLNNKKKEDNLGELLTLLDGVSFNEGCPVLVGGYFNLKYENAENVVQNRNKNNEIKYNLYAAASKKKKMKGMKYFFMYSGPVEDVSNVDFVDDDNKLFDHKPLYANFKQSELAQNRHGNAAPSPSPFAKKELFQQENDSPLLDSKLSENSELNYLRAENAELQSTVEKLKVDLYYVTKERDFLQTVVKDSRQVVINCCADIHREKYGPFPEQKE